MDNVFKQETARPLLPVFLKNHPSLMTRQLFTPLYLGTRPHVVRRNAAGQSEIICTATFVPGAYRVPRVSRENSRLLRLRAQERRNYFLRYTKSS